MLLSKGANPTVIRLHKMLDFCLMIEAGMYERAWTTAPDPLVANGYPGSNAFTQPSCVPQSNAKESPCPSYYVRGSVRQR